MNIEQIDPFLILSDELRLQSFNQTRKSPAYGVNQDPGSLAKVNIEEKPLYSMFKRPHGEVYAPFGNSMIISAHDVKVIQDIIIYLDNRSTISIGLPANQRHLKEEGKKIEHVHPLCFIWAILHRPDLKEKLRNFRDNSAFALKWNGFLGYSSFHDKGFGRNLERYYNHRSADEYIHEFKDFYRSLNLKEEKLNPHVYSKNWRGFASALLDHDSYF